MDNRTEPVVPGVWRVEVGPLTNAYVIADDGHGDREGLTLVDAGGRDGGPRLVRSIRLLGLDPRAVGRVLVTHWHADHAGSAARFAASSAASTVHALSPDVDVLRRGTRPRGGEAGPLARLAGRGRRLPPTAPEAVELVDGQDLDVAGGLAVVAAPGHTHGHAAFLLRRPGVLFCGDALRTVPRLAAPSRYLHADPSSAAATLRRLADLAPRVLAPGHGRLLRDEVSERLGRLARARSRSR